MKLKLKSHSYCFYENDIQFYPLKRAAAFSDQHCLNNSPKTTGSFKSDLLVLCKRDITVSGSSSSKDLFRFLEVCSSPEEDKGLSAISKWSERGVVGSLFLVCQFDVFSALLRGHKGDMISHDNSDVHHLILELSYCYESTHCVHPHLPRSVTCKTSSSLAYLDGNQRRNISHR